MKILKVCAICSFCVILCSCSQSSDKDKDKDKDKKSDSGGSVLPANSWPHATGHVGPSTFGSPPEKESPRNGSTGEENGSRGGSVGENGSHGSSSGEGGFFGFGGHGGGGE